MWVGGCLVGGCDVGGRVSCGVVMWMGGCLVGVVMWVGGYLVGVVMWVGGYLVGVFAPDINNINSHFVLILFVYSYRQLDQNPRGQVDKTRQIFVNFVFKHINSTAFSLNILGSQWIIDFIHL